MKKIILTISLLIPAFSYAGVIVGDKEWRQIPETVGFSWNQIATVCNPISGACSGSLGSVNFTGYEWASMDHVTSLFNAYIPGAPLGPGPDILQEADSSWAPSFFIDFLSAGSTATRNLVSGWSRTLHPTDPARATRPQFWDELNPIGLDTAITGSYRLLDNSFPDRGVWLFRPAAVPEPATVGLLGLGLIGLGFFRLRRAI